MHEPFSVCNFLIIICTGIFSYRGFRDPHFEDRYIFRPNSILASKEYYRLFTSAFLHANWTHLIFNMMSLYFFGAAIELASGVPQFLTIYFGGIVGGSLLSLWIHRHHEYSAYGASGGVCGIIFAHIFIFPGGSIQMFPLPYSVPSWLYAICFLLGSFYALKAQRDNIGHDAHLGGAICGLLIATALDPSIVRRTPKLFTSVLLLSGLLMVYLVINPLLLPLGPLFSSIFSKKFKHSHMPGYKLEELRMDDLLEKVSDQGIDSLTQEEKAFLNRVSRKYQTRAESKPPESGLTF